MEETRCRKRHVLATVALVAASDVYGHLAESAADAAWKTYVRPKVSRLSANYSERILAMTEQVRIVRYSPETLETIAALADALNLWTRQARTLAAECSLLIEAIREDLKNHLPTDNEESVGELYFEN